MTLEKWAKNPHPRKNVLKLLVNDAKKICGDKREILLSFMSDPYHSAEASKYTHDALEIMEKYNLRVQILTKNPQDALKDIEIIKRNNWKIATTAIFFTESKKKEFEKNTPSMDSRFMAMNIFNKNKIKTWVSIEPIIDLEEAMLVINRMKVVDLIKIGRWNYDKRANEINWEYVADQTSSLCRSLNVSYYIKNDLFKYANDKTRLFGQSWKSKNKK